MLTIYVAVATFLIMTLVLVAVLLIAKAKLVPSGDVKVEINEGEREITAKSGGSLLNTLSSSKIFLPSACGGQGNCGMCKCQVVSGGREILPTEVGFFNRKQIKTTTVSPVR